MSRSVKPWVGKTDDTPVPPRVRQRVFLAKDGKCHKCGRTIRRGVEPWTCEHLIALCNGGRNAEDNLGLTCCNCLPAKNAADVAEKKIVARKAKKHLGIKLRKGPGFPCGKDSAWKKPFGSWNAVRR